MPTFVTGFKNEFEYLCFLNQLSKIYQKPETQKKLQKFSKTQSEILGSLLAEILLESKIKAAAEAKLNKDKADELSLSVPKKI